MTSVVADYQPVHIGRLRLGVGADIDRTFRISLPVETSAEAPMIVTFLLVSSDDLHLRIEFNGTVVSDRQYTHGPERSIQEFANHIAFSTSGPNTLTFTILRGEGLFSDIALWSRRAAADSGGDIGGGIFAGVLSGDIGDTRRPLADYVPLHIGRAVLAVGADVDRSLEFRLPEKTSGDFPMILTFLLVSSEDLHMRVEFNGTLVSDRRYTNGPERCIQDVANHVAFSTSGLNTITFTVLQGRVLFSDAVLHFKRDTISP